MLRQPGLAQSRERVAAAGGRSYLLYENPVAQRVRLVRSETRFPGGTNPVCPAAANSSSKGSQLIVVLDANCSLLRTIENNGTGRKSLALISFYNPRA
jgi:hypothetical protein